MFTRHPSGTFRLRARATNPSTSTSSSPTYPHPQPPYLTTPSDPRCGFLAEDNYGAWQRYHRALHNILRRPVALTLTTASHTRTPPDLTLQQLVHDIWTAKEELATLQHPSTPEAQEGDTHLRAFLTTCCHQLQEWHAHRMAAAPQEREGYRRNDMPYKSLRYLSRILEDT